MDKETEGAREVYSKVIRAGRRTYFFDVKATRDNDYFVTITESRKMNGGDGTAYYEKHKIHLYKEDFDKYMDGLENVLNYIKYANSQHTHTNGKSKEVRSIRSEEEMHTFATGEELDK